MAVRGYHSHYNGRGKPVIDSLNFSKKSQLFSWRSQWVHNECTTPVVMQLVKNHIFSIYKTAGKQFLTIKSDSSYEFYVPKQLNTTQLHTIQSSITLYSKLKWQKKLKFKNRRIKNRNLLGVMGLVTYSYLKMVSSCLVTRTSHHYLHSGWWVWLPCEDIHLWVLPSSISSSLL